MNLGSKNAPIYWSFPSQRVAVRIADGARVTLGVRLARLQCHEVYMSGDCRVVATNAIEDVPASP